MQEVEYLGYYSLAEYSYRVDRPKETHMVGRPGNIQTIQHAYQNMHHTADSIVPHFSGIKKHNISKSPRYVSICRGDLSGVSYRQVNLPRCASHYRVRIKFSLSMAAFKGTIRRNPFRGEHVYHERKYLKYLMLIYLA